MRTLDRRDILRAGLLTVGGLALPSLLGGCSKGGGGAKTLTRAASLREVFDALAKEGGKQAVDAFLAGEDWVAGIPNHLGFGIVRKGSDPIVGKDARIWLAPSPDLSGKPIGPFTASWHGYSKPQEGGPKGINAADVTFDKDGVWTLLLDIRPDGSKPLLGVAAIQVKARDKASTKIPGQRAIPSETPTVKNSRGVNPICTREPACDMHDVTLKQALASGKPSVFIMATPKFCMSRTCGPNLEELIAVKRVAGDRAVFVHAEVYKDDKPETISKFIASPAFKQWGFQSEPWLFVMDHNGTIVSRFEGPLTASEIRAVLDPLL
ncbi:MAG: TlpA family protein disulfide reductase [Actinomycetota bacterium]